MDNYYYKYLKYKSKYMKFKNIIYNQNGGKPKQVIIHISGSQGSGKTTLGNKLVEQYKHKIKVFDLDILRDEYNKSSKTNCYQDFLDDIIKNNKTKPLIFTGLDAELCLGLMKDSKIMYELDTDYKFYIESSNNTLKQRFFRQIDKLNSRKEWFFEEWTKNPDVIQDKLFRFVDLTKWTVNNAKCDVLYTDRNYEFMDSNEIYNAVCEILEKYFKNK